MHTDSGDSPPIDGQLLLSEDPMVWIQKNPTRLLSVQSLELDFYRHGGEGIIGYSIGQLTKLTHLSIKNVKTITCLPNILTTFPNLQMLELYECDKLQELPPNLGDLESLTSLSVSFCDSLKALPDSLAKLSKLANLVISFCNCLEELPANFGELESLMQFTLTCCNSIKSLPDSFAKLSKLTKLNISGCANLKELPVGELESLTHFTLKNCSSIKSLPSSVAKLSKLTTLNIHSCDSLQNLPANLGELKSLTHLCIEKCRSLKECPSNLNVVDLSLRDCCSIQLLPRGLSNLVRLNLSLCSNTGEERLYFASLRHLQFQECSLCKSYVKELPANLDKLPQLSLLDIHETRIKCLPSSIMKLSKLRLLLLPSRFILETLPYQLDESLVISVNDSHVRKTWKELKKEMEIFSSPTVRVDPSGYLPLTGDPTQWIQEYCTSLSMVRILDLDLGYGSTENITDSFANLTELTHLHITDGVLTRLPLQLSRITHLSLYDCEFKSSLDSLGKLSTLESLHISLCDKELLDQMDLPVSLRQLTLCLGKNPAPLLDSMTKLSNLKALHLFGKGIHFDSLPEVLNLKKLKLVDCYIKSLPRGLRHVEILHGKEIVCLHDCYELGNFFNQLVDVETLSVTCHRMEFLPSIAGLHNLQELQLKDCFSFKELPANLDVMVNLCTLNVSGTRIKSLPFSISKLPKLQYLILPKCFQPGSLPLKFRTQSIMVSIDDTDDKYYKYKNMGYYDFVHETYSEVDNNTMKTIERVNKVVSKESEEGIISQQQTSPHLLLNQPDVSPVIGGSHGSEANHPLGKNSHHAFFSLQNQDTEMLPSESEQLTADNRHLNLQEPCFPSIQHALRHEHMVSMTSEIEHGLPPNFQHDFSRGTGKNLLVSDYGQNEDSKHREEYSPNFQETIHFGGSSQHDLQNIQMPENVTWFNQEVLKESEMGIIKDPQQTSRRQMLSLLDALADSNSNSTYNLVGKNSHHAISRSEICEKKITESSFNFQETVSFGRNSQHAVQNGQMDVINSETEHEITFLNQEISSRNERDVSRSGYNLNTLENQQFDKKSQNEGEKSKKHKIEITMKDIRRLGAKGMTLVEAAKELKVSRSTLKRKLKDFEIKWPSSRIADKKKRNTSTNLPSIKSSTQVNMVPVDQEHAMEGLDGADWHIFSDHCNVIDNSTIDATVETVKVPGETQLHTDDHVVNSSSLSNAVQKSGSSCSFVVKATYKEDTVKFVSSAATVVEIKKEVADNLELEKGKFKIKYEDSDRELLLMTTKEHLEDARNLSYSSGRNFLRLFIIDL